MTLAFLIEGLKKLDEPGQMVQGPGFHVYFEQERLREIAKLNGCPYFDPTVQFAENFLLFFSSYPPAKHKRLVHFMLDVLGETLRGLPGSEDNQILKKYILPDYNKWRNSQSPVPDYPVWLTKMRTANNETRKQLKMKMVENIYKSKGSGNTPIERYENEKISLFTWVNTKCFRAFIEFLLAHPGVTDVIAWGFDPNLILLADRCGEVSKVSYRSPSGHDVNLELSECRQANLEIDDRVIKVVVFLGDQGKQHSFDHISEYVQSRGLRVPKVDPREMAFNYGYGLLYALQTLRLEDKKQEQKKNNRTRASGHSSAAAVPAEVPAAAPAAAASAVVAPAAAPAAVPAWQRPKR